MVRGSSALIPYSTPAKIRVVAKDKPDQDIHPSEAHHSFQDQSHHFEPVRARCGAPANLIGGLPGIQRVLWLFRTTRHLARGLYCSDPRTDVHPENKLLIVTFNNASRLPSPIHRSGGTWPDAFLSVQTGTLRSFEKNSLALPTRSSLQSRCSRNSTRGRQFEFIEV